jgi:hypothetical protein
MSRVDGDQLGCMIVLGLGQLLLERLHLLLRLGEFASIDAISIGKNPIQVGGGGPVLVLAQDLLLLSSESLNPAQDFIDWRVLQISFCKRQQQYHLSGMGSIALARQRQMLGCNTFELVQINLSAGVSVANIAMLPQ